MDKGKVDEFWANSQAFESLIHHLKFLFLSKHARSLFKKNPAAIWIGAFHDLFNEYAVSSHPELEEVYTVIQKQGKEEVAALELSIMEAAKNIQSNKLAKLREALANSKYEKEILEALEQMRGSLSKTSVPLKDRNPIEVAHFNGLLDILKHTFTESGGLLIEQDKYYVNVLSLLNCFESLELPLQMLRDRRQDEWLKVLLVEHIIEKYNLIFPNSDKQEYLYNKLFKNEEKLLLLFNNMFVSEYGDQIGEVNEAGLTEMAVSSYQKITHEQFLTIVKLMNNIKVDKSILEKLANTSLMVWDTILNEIYFVQIFNKKVASYCDKINYEECEKTLLLLNRIRIKEGTNSIESFMTFFTLAFDKVLESGKFEDVISLKVFNLLLSAIYYQEITFKEANHIIAKPYHQWQEELKQHQKARSSKAASVGERTAAELVSIMKENYGSQFNAVSKEILDKAADKGTKYWDKAQKYGDTNNVLEGNEKIFIHSRIQALHDLKEYQDNKEAYVLAHLDEIVPLLIYAWSVANTTQFPRATQIISLLFAIYSNDIGLLQQVSTGEGKTQIVGLIAAFKGLCGYAVDIVSSNRDLALEGEHKCHAFLELLKLKSGHICSDDDAVNYKAYENDIVYGIIGNFQRDILEQESNGKKTFGERYVVKKKCLIVDEADNMALDKARHVLYLSHSIEALKWLENVFVNIWAAALRADIQDPDDIEKHIKDISDFMLNRIKARDIIIPKKLAKFVQYKMPVWVDSAFQARLMQEDDHFILDIPKTSDTELNKAQPREIIVLDKDTGVEQYSTRWSNGLAQFMELKYRRKLSIESLKAIFISNKAFFQRYGKNLYGLTGTLGSTTSQRFLAGVYPVQFAIIPTSKEKRYRQLPGMVAEDLTSWLEKIASRTIEVAANCPVLVILENIERVEKLEKALLMKGVSAQSIVMYTRDGHDVEQRFRKKPATAGDIILATNKGGRGTDIEVDEAVDSIGGLNVLLGYMPENDRIEDQNFGRTSRKGNNGTGQFILQIDVDNHKELFKNKSSISSALDELAEVIILKEKQNRDERERLRLKELQQKNILQLELEEELFLTFVRFKNETLDKFLKEKFGHLPEKLKEAVISATHDVFKDKWAFWLDKKKEQIDKVENAAGKHAVLKSLQQYLQQKAETVEKITLDTLLNTIVKKPEEAIHLGQAYLYVDKGKTPLPEHLRYAKLCFQKATELGDFSGFSYIGLAYCIINLKEGDVKKEARRALKEAINALEYLKILWMGNRKVAEVLAKVATPDVLKKVSSKDNYYFDQIQGKLEVIGLHLHYLTTAAGTYLQPFDFASTNNEADMKKAREIYDYLVKEKLLHGDVLRKKYRKNISLAEKIIRKQLDSCIADELIQLFRSKGDIELNWKEALEGIVCSNQGLWEFLNLPPALVKPVFVLDKERVKKELEASFQAQWQAIESRITNPNDVDITLFSGTSALEELRKLFEKKKILVQTNRIKTTDLETHLKGITLDPNSRYSKFSSEGGKIKGVQGYLVKRLELKTAKFAESPGNEAAQYIYQDELPFGSKEEEASKILIFLKEANILKSGGLGRRLKDKLKDGDDLKDILEDILKDSPYKQDKELIKGKLTAAQGDIRKWKDDLKASLTLFMDLKDQPNVPVELPFFMGLGLHKFLIIEEDKSWWDWGAFAVAMIGVAQIILGAVLCAVGVVNFGNALISEGINDIVYATMALISGNFSWKEWAAQKIISFSISMLTAGVQTLASIGKTAAKLGSASVMGMVGKILTRCIIEVAVNVLTNVLSEAAVTEIQRNIIDKIIEEILGKIGEGLKTELEKIGEKGVEIDEFLTFINQLSTNIQQAIKQVSSILEQFSHLKSSLTSTLEGSFKKIAEGLKNSSSPYIKAVGTAINVGALVNDLWNGVKMTMDLADTIQSFVEIVQKTIKEIEKLSNSAGSANTIEKQQALKRRLEAEINNFIAQIKREISNTLMVELRKALQAAISGAISGIAQMSNERAMKRMDSQFQGQDTVAMARIEAAVDHAKKHSKHVAELAKGENNPKKLSEKLKQAKLKELQESVQLIKTVPFVERCQKQMQALGLPDNLLERLSEVRSVSDLRNLGEDVLRTTGEKLGTKVVGELTEKVKELEAVKTATQQVKSVISRCQSQMQALGVSQETIEKLTKVRSVADLKTVGEDMAVSVANNIGSNVIDNFSKKINELEGLKKSKEEIASFVKEWQTKTVALGLPSDVLERLSKIRNVSDLQNLGEDVLRTTGEKLGTQIISELSAKGKQLESVRTAIQEVRTVITRCQSQMQELGVSQEMIERLTKVRSVADLKTVGEDIAVSMANNIGSSVVDNFYKKIHELEGLKKSKEEIALFVKEWQTKTAALGLPSDMLTRLTRVRSISDLQDLGEDVLRTTGEKLGTQIVSDLSEKVKQLETFRTTVQEVRSAVSHCQSQMQELGMSQEMIEKLTKVRSAADLKTVGEDIALSMANNIGSSVVDSFYKKVNELEGLKKSKEEIASFVKEWQTKTAALGLPSDVLTRLTKVRSARALRKLGEDVLRTTGEKLGNQVVGELIGKTKQVEAVRTIAHEVSSAITRCQHQVQELGVPQDVIEEITKVRSITDLKTVSEAIASNIGSSIIDNFSRKIYALGGLKNSRKEIALFVEEWQTKTTALELPSDILERLTEVRSVDDLRNLGRNVLRRTGEKLGAQIVSGLSERVKQLEILRTVTQEVTSVVTRCQSQMQELGIPQEMIEKLTTVRSVTDLKTVGEDIAVSMANNLGSNVIDNFSKKIHELEGLKKSKEEIALFVKEWQTKTAALELPSDVLTRLIRVRSISDLQYLGKDVLRTTGKKLGTQVVSDLFEKVKQLEAVRTVEQGVSATVTRCQSQMQELGVSQEMIEKLTKVRSVADLKTVGEDIASNIGSNIIDNFSKKIHELEGLKKSREEIALFVKEWQTKTAALGLPSDVLEKLIEVRSISDLQNFGEAVLRVTEKKLGAQIVSNLSEKIKQLETLRSVAQEVRSAIARCQHQMQGLGISKDILEKLTKVQSVADLKTVGEDIALSMANNIGSNIIDNFSNKIHELEGLKKSREEIASFIEGWKTKAAALGLPSEMIEELAKVRSIRDLQNMGEGALARMKRKLHTSMIDTVTQKMRELKQTTEKVEQLEKGVKQFSEKVDVSRLEKVLAVKTFSKNAERIKNNGLLRTLGVSDALIDNVVKISTGVHTKINTPSSSLSEERKKTEERMSEKVGNGVPGSSPELFAAVDEHADVSSQAAEAPAITSDKRVRRAPASVSSPAPFRHTTSGVDERSRAAQSSIIPVRLGALEPVLFQYGKKRQLKINIVRTSENTQSITGELYVNGKYICQTLELPYRGNMKEISSIPEEDYGAILRYDHKDRWRLELTGTGSRTHIQIHIGNYPKDVKGCILVGDNAFPKENRIANSKSAYLRLREAFYGTFLPNSTPDVFVTVSIRSKKSLQEQFERANTDIEHLLLGDKSDKPAWR